MAEPQKACALPAKLYREIVMAAPPLTPYPPPSQDLLRLSALSLAEEMQKACAVPAESLQGDPQTMQGPTRAKVDEWINTMAERLLLIDAPQNKQPRLTIDLPTRFHRGPDYAAITREVSREG